MITMGATEQDIALMAGTCSRKVKIKAAGGIKNFDNLLKMRQLGASRIGTSSTQLILEECRESLSLKSLRQKIFKTTQGY
jgi:deoxyribose-phosphate aldolase